jgi:hypothetical protein
MSPSMVWNEEEMAICDQEKLVQCLFGDHTRDSSLAWNGGIGWKVRAGFLSKYCRQPPASFQGLVSLGHFGPVCTIPRPKMSRFKQSIAPPSPFHEVSLYLRMGTHHEDRGDVLALQPLAEAFVLCEHVLSSRTFWLESPVVELPANGHSGDC